MPIDILDNETVLGTLSSSSTIYDGNGGNSTQWNSAYSIANSLQSSSGNWQSTYATVCALSANWQSAYASTTALNLSSNKWNSAYTLINTTTATTFNVNNLSATGTVYANSVSVPTISANNTFSSGNQYVISDGAGNNNTGNGANTISLNALSGTFIGSNLTVKGNLSAAGNVISNGSWTNSVYTGISGDGVIIDYLQGSPGLGRISVGNGTGTDSLAFYSNGPAYSPTTSTLYLSSNGYVGINTNAPNTNLTVNGTISATGAIYGGNIYSNGVQLTNSGGGGTVDTGVRALTGNWQSTYVTVCALSANWQSAYTNQSNYLPLSGGTITGQLNVNGVVTASGSNVTLNIINTSSNRVFSNADNNKVIHFNTNSGVLTASIPSGLQAGFNVALMNTGTNNVYLSSQTTLFASGSSVASGYGGALIYTDSSNNVFAVGRLF